MLKKSPSLLHSFRFAGRGIGQSVRSERNMRLHLCAALLVVAAGLIFDISVGEWLVLLVFLGLIPALECVNTAIEQVCDVVRDECGGKYEHLGTPRDVAAGAVLWASGAAAIAGLIIFVPKIIGLWG
ncbi:diacylglycerol kinase family protein [bacterium]|nr:diacylglycerol kinase family protein [bacterium]